MSDSRDHGKQIEFLVRDMHRDNAVFAQQAEIAFERLGGQQVHGDRIAREGVEDDHVIHDPGSGLVAPAFNKLEHDHLTLVRGQVHQGIPKLLSFDVPVHFLHRPAALLQVQLILKRRCLDRIPAIMVGDPVVGGPIQVCLEIVRWASAVPEDFQETTKRL